MQKYGSSESATSYVSLLSILVIHLFNYLFGPQWLGAKVFQKKLRVTWQAPEEEDTDTQVKMMSTLSINEPSVSAVFTYVIYRSRLLQSKGCTLSHPRAAEYIADGVTSSIDVQWVCDLTRQLQNPLLIASRPLSTHREYVTSFESCRTHRSS